MLEPLDSNLFLVPGRCDKVQVKPGLDVRRSGRYPYCLIHYVHSGTMYVNCAEETVEVHSGESFLLPAYSVHRYCAPQSALVTWAEFYGVNSQTVFESAVLQNGLVVAKQASAPLLRDLETLLDVCQDPYRASLAIFRLLMDLMEGVRLRPASKKVLQEAIGYIQLHLDEKLDAETLAGLCGYSTSYFSRLFHRTYGDTVSQYILRRRLEAAKRLLEQPGWSVSKIAESTGFSDSSHFIKVFRDTYGETPGVFRRHLNMYLGQSL